MKFEKFIRYSVIRYCKELNSILKKINYVSQYCKNYSFVRNRNDDNMIIFCNYFEILTFENDKETCTRIMFFKSTNPSEKKIATITFYETKENTKVSVNKLSKIKRT